MKRLLLAAAVVSFAAHSSAKDDKLVAQITAQLAANDPHAMYVAIDKPLYHPGETVWFRSFEVARKTMTAIPGNHGMTFQLFDPKGGKLLEKRVLGTNGGATNDFELPAGLPGGQYTLRAISDLGPQEDKPFAISSYETPRVKKTVDLARKSYGPGEEVSAAMHFERATGDGVSFGKLTIVATVDGVEINRQNLATDWRGHARVRFWLPKSIEKGDATLTVMVNDGGATESIQKRVPIVLDHLALVAFPEGGDLVAGLPSRVYFAAHDPLGKPTETEGTVSDETGAVVAHFRSFHAGMGRFELTPAEGHTYTMKVTKPAGIAQTFTVPKAKSTGCTMKTEDDYVSAKSDVRLKVWCKTPQTLSATAVVRDRLIGKTSAEISGPTTISIPAPHALGATRITLFDGANHPVAERVVYRGVRSGLKVTITADKTAYAPRDKVTLAIQATDGEGKPVPNADLALSVVDDTVLNFADDKTPNMLARLYLEPEMPGQKIFEPNFYFTNDAKAPQALDLLLGTLGYRRFEWKLQ